MKFAIIAAGEGSRLAAEGVDAPKPLVRIHGERLIDRLVRIFMENGAEEIVAICNDRMADVEQRLHDISNKGLNGKRVPLRYVVKSTPGSMHSFCELSAYLYGGLFVLTTVDTIFREDEFAAYVKAFRDAGTPMFPVTDFIDDERPLYVGTNDNGLIDGFYDAPHGCRYISTGIYGLTPDALHTLHGCMERGEVRMRQFQRALIADGMQIRYFPMSKVLDIDHKSDIEKAEQFLAEASGIEHRKEKMCTIDAQDTKEYGTPRKAMMIGRAPRFSPNAEEKDAAILKAVGDILEKQGFAVAEYMKEDALAEKGIKVVPDDVAFIFSMARSEDALAVLQEATEKGIRVINNPQGVTLCNSRRSIDQLMRDNDVPTAPHYIRGAGWVKSDRGHDVCFCPDEQTVSQKMRTLAPAIATAHLEGHEVKFYGVVGRFFHPADYDDIRQTAERLSRLTGVEVYGGDAIVNANGTFAIIDFNDWPSFAACRDEAAGEIARMAMPENDAKH